MISSAHPCFRMLGLGVATFLVLGACSGGTDTTPSANGGGQPSAGEGEELEVSAVDNLFEPSSLAAPAGSQVTVAISNDGENPHTFTITELDVDTSTIAAGDSATASFTMPETPVTFYCEIHGDKTMSGTIEPS